MTAPNFDVLAIGDAVVDVIARADDGLIAELGLTKGSMRVLDAEEAVSFYDRMGPARETSGGSAANTIAGIAAMGGKAAFVGQIADDQLGAVFAHDMRAMGVAFDTPPLGADVPTGRCLILVTPDAQRTMSTFPGAAHCLAPEAIDPKTVGQASVVYLEAYLWRTEGPRAAMRKAMEIARQKRRKIAFTLSDIACIQRHRRDFRELIQDGMIDILFANEEEARTLCQQEDSDAAIALLSGQIPLLIVTRSERGAIGVEGKRRVEVPAMPVERVVDTTGAGDLFAAGVLFGKARGQSLEESLQLGAAAAAEIISHFGARPEADLRALVRR